MIGRHGVAVADPFDAYRTNLGGRAAAIDDAATLKGEEVVDWHGALLGRRELELRASFGGMLPELAAVLSSERRRDAAEAGYFSALENAALVEGLASVDLAPSELAVERMDLWSLAIAARSRLNEIYDDMELPRDPGLDLDAFQAEAAEWIAIAREQAIREALIDPEAHQPTSEVKEIGAGRLVAILEDEEAAEARLREDSPLPRSARVVERADVSAPRALDALLDRVGVERAERWGACADALVDSIEGAPDSWIRDRRAELGRPGDLIKRGAALKTLSLEAAQAAARKRFEQAHVDAMTWRESDPEAAAVADGVAGKAQAELDELKASLDRLYEKGRHLDAQLARDDYRLLRAIAYEDEFELRRNLKIAQEVERSLVDPPDNVLDLIGDSWGLAAPELEEWESIAREIELNRLSRESAEREGLEPPVRDPRAERRLAERIDRVRADRGMEPRARAPEPSRDTPGFDAG